MENNTPLVYSPKDIKVILHAGNSTLHELLNREENPIPHFRIGRRIVVPHDLFQDWLVKQTTNTQDNCD